MASSQVLTRVGEWSLRTVGNYSRARRLDDYDLLPSVRARLDRIEALIERFTDVQPYLLAPDGSHDVGEDWLGKLSSASANILQFTRPLPVIASSADDAIDDLWDELIVEPTSKRFRFAKKHRAVAAVSRALKARAIPDESIVQRTTVESVSYHSPIDFAIRNGKVTHLTNCWSFQLPDKEGLLEEITSWAWTVRDLRRNGGKIFVGSEAIEVRKKAPILSSTLAPEQGKEGTNKPSRALRWRSRMSTYTSRRYRPRERLPWLKRRLDN